MKKADDQKKSSEFFIDSIYETFLDEIQKRSL